MGVWSTSRTRLIDCQPAMESQPSGIIPVPDALPESRRGAARGGRARRRCKFAQQDIARQGGLARPRHPRHHGQAPQGDLRVDLAQVVQGGALDFNHGRIAPDAAAAGSRMLQRRGKTSAGRGVAQSGKFRGRALRHDGAATRAGARPQIDHMVRRGDGVFVVLHDDQGVALGAQAIQRIEESHIVARMQADGGFVQHIADALQVRTQLGGQADTLGFTAGKSRRRAIQLQIAQADVAEKTGARGEFRQQIAGDVAFTPRQLEILQRCGEFLHRQIGQRGDRSAAEQHMQRYRVLRRRPAHSVQTTAGVSADGSAPACAPPASRHLDSSPLCSESNSSSCKPCRSSPCTSRASN